MKLFNSFNFFYQTIKNQHHRDPCITIVNLIFWGIDSNDYKNKMYEDLEIYKLKSTFDVY